MKAWGLVKYINTRIKKAVTVPHFFLTETKYDAATISRINGASDAPLVA
jgi:hypothetical protein